MDLQLTSLRADQTRRFTISGMRVNGHHEDLVLLVVWTGSSKAYQDGVTNKAFTKLEGAEYRAELNRLLAQHIVVGWECVPTAAATKGPDVEGKPITYTAKRGEQILAQFEKDERPDRRNRFLAFVTEGDLFQAPLVDPGDLGNE